MLYIYVIYIIYLLCIYIYTNMFVIIYTHIYIYVCVCPPLELQLLWRIPFNSGPLSRILRAVVFRNFSIEPTGRSFPGEVESKPVRLSHEKNPTLLSIQSWLVNRDPYNLIMIYFKPYIIG